MVWTVRVFSYPNSFFSPPSCPYDLILLGFIFSCGMTTVYIQPEFFPFPIFLPRHPAVFSVFLLFSQCVGTWLACHILNMV